MGGCCSSPNRLLFLFTQDTENEISVDLINTLINTGKIDVNAEIGLLLAVAFLVSSSFLLPPLQLKAKTRYYTYWPLTKTRTTPLKFKPF
jgi:hypothetical protein